MTEDQSVGTLRELLKPINEKYGIAERSKLREMARVNTHLHD